MIGTIRRMSALGLLAIAAGGVVGLGCGSDDEELPGGYSQPCSTGEVACTAGLMCAQGLCTIACTDSAGCQQVSQNAICDGYCFEACRDSFNCQPPLVCKMVVSIQGTCRPQ
jgi:hypothetical protein